MDSLFGPTSPQAPFSHNVIADNWELLEPTLPTLHSIPVSETLFTIGNGFIGVRGYAEETQSPGASDYCHRGNTNDVNDSLRCGYLANPPSSSSENCFTKMESVVDRANDGSPGRAPSSPCATLHRANSLVPKESTRGTYIAGFAEQRLLASRNRPFAIGQCSKESFLVRVPDAFSIDVFIAGEHVCTSTGTIKVHNRRLDLKSGELRRRMVWESHTHPGREVYIEATRFASTVRKCLACVRYTVSARNVSNTDIRIVSRIEFSEDTKSLHSCGVETVLTGYNIQEASSVVLVRTQNSCRHLAVATLDRCCSMVQSQGPMNQFAGASATSLGSGGSTSEKHFPSSADASITGMMFPSVTGTSASATSLAPKSSETDNGTETTFTSCISEGVFLQLSKYIGYYGDDEAPQEELCDLSAQRTMEAACIGYDALVQEHRYAMSRFWETADIRYKGSRSIQEAFRFNILQIFMSYGQTSTYGFPTRGLTGEIMGGVHQWDVDMFVIPTLTHISPEIARRLLQFRINTLPQAKNLAIDLELSRGAVYPFRTINGTDNPTSYCAAFLFVNATIAYAMRQYVVATNDYTILTSGGAEVILATALVWIDWGTWNKGVFHLRSVSGPDMYNGSVDNNFFTNIMAQEHMRWMVQIANYFREKWLIRWNEILEHCLATEEDIIAFDKAASKMFLPYDGSNRIHLADQGFMRKKKWPFDDLKTTTRHGNSLEKRFHPSVIHRHQLCRIPDVLLAHVLMSDRFTSEETRANFQFYEAITSSDSALRLVINSVLAARLRMDTKALDSFRHAIFVDLSNFIGNTGGGLHCTTAAGAVWALAAGFAGMQVIEGILHFNPTLPDGCEEYQFHTRHLGCLVRVQVGQRVVTYTMLEACGNIKEILLIHAGSTRITLRTAAPETVRLFRQLRVFDFDCVIFDLDSILIDIEDFHYEAWKLTLEQFFHEVDFPEFSMTKELYLAYLRHNTPVTGLAEVFKRFGRPPLPVGDLTDSNRTHSVNGLCNRKLQFFRQCVQCQGLRFREGSLELLASLRRFGISTGCVTGSKNGRWLIDEAPQLKVFFDDFLDGNDGEEMELRWRPEMDYFAASAKHMDCLLGRTIIIVDGTDGFSKSRIERSCLLIDVSDDPESIQFDIPRMTVSHFTGLTMEVLEEHTARNGVAHHRDAALGYHWPPYQSITDSINLFTSPTSNSQVFPEGHPNATGGVVS